ncbi:MAG: exosome complex protein Rrp42 [Candidatus Aenigmarchaeota archaeon]|nr:exosome complex protein Rrp42 [Candidatus Aenigmarchaeota archaeon]
MIHLDPIVVQQLAERDKRLDKRALDEYRPITIETDVVTSAEGSARVRMGKTELIAGIKMALGEPFEDTPDEGVIIVGVEFVPLADAEFESGPPDRDAVETARVIDRAIRESKCIDLKKLVVEEGKKVWMISIDIDVLDNDGNLIDAGSLAAVAALLTAKIPDCDEKGSVITDRKGSVALPVHHKPVSTTFGKIGNKILVDPNRDEMNALDARLTVGTFEEHGAIKYASMQKGCPGGFTFEEIEQILDLAAQKGKELRALL